MCKTYNVRVCDRRHTRDAAACAHVLRMCVDDVFAWRGIMQLCSTSSSGMYARVPQLQCNGHTRWMPWDGSVFGIFVECVSLFSVFGDEKHHITRTTNSNVRQGPRRSCRVWVLFHQRASHNNAHAFECRQECASRTEYVRVCVCALVSREHSHSKHTHSRTMASAYHRVCVYCVGSVNRALRLSVCVCVCGSIHMHTHESVHYVHACDRLCTI